MRIRYGLIWTVLLTVGTFQTARAQRIVGVLGGGMTLSGSDVSAQDFHGMAGVTFGSSGHLGFRLDALASAVPQGSLFGFSGSLVFTIDDPETAPRGLYFLAGGALVLSRGEAHPALNGGLGYRIPLQPRLAAFIEGRYFRVLGGYRDVNLILGTVGLRFPL